ncbi:MAG: YfbU family protein [Flavobacteriales bacterium]|nr:YfbU family protein [Flavobacteriales bacterium]MCW8912577.1 YfbU family protein [Flavobacteriales bacterium]MCW8938182.1 YfbU family protein [Flavobacteriales bacterium]MCW8941014.1 YfbU family protein [Flavobacteriales bacterium]MCW8967026.1 YfbU family protein [Flavobacteriales bacterium]
MNNQEIKITDTERMTLINQYRILSHLEITAELKEECKKSLVILESRLPNCYFLLLSDELKKMPLDVIEEVTKIWEMFNDLKKQAAQFEKEVSIEKFKFFGFHESTEHYLVYRFLRMGLSVKDLNEPWRYRNKDENSLECFREMLEVYNSVLFSAKDNQNVEWSIDDINLLVNVINKYEVDKPKQGMVDVAA